MNRDICSLTIKQFIHYLSFLNGRKSGSMAELLTD
jgi:hypothetical protein